MELLRDIGSMRRVRRAWDGEGARVALVPTMGFFHEGHLALMRLARRLCDRVAVSLFVNPIQFGPSEDLATYPRDLGRDRELAAAAGADALFVPGEDEMYPDGPPAARVVPGEMAAVLCGRSRPGHFDGVCTVVAKLFNIVRPDCAVFGRKDFQQLAVVRRMARDLDFPVEIVGHPTVREPDGLAMSSRNSYLSAAEREQAVCLVEGLRLARRLYDEGERSCARLRREVGSLISGYPLARPEYVELVDSRSLARVETADSRTLLALAVRVGRTRLIDNTILADRDSP